MFVGAQRAIFRLREALASLSVARKQAEEESECSGCSRKRIEAVGLDLYGLVVCKSCCDHVLNRMADYYDGMNHALRQLYKHELAYSRHWPTLPRTTTYHSIRESNREPLRGGPNNHRRKNQCYRTSRGAILVK